jgi:hypothetical protein
VTLGHGDATGQVHTVEDARFRIVRVVLPAADATAVLFYATDLTTGATMRLGPPAMPARAA